MLCKLSFPLFKDTNNAWIIYNSSFFNIKLSVDWFSFLSTVTGMRQVKSGNSKIIIRLNKPQK
jgi:hypothetical protein